MNFPLASTFNDSLLKLAGEDQKAAKATAFDLQLGPVSLEINFIQVNHLGT